MKALIVCASVSHGNTARIADAMGEVLAAPVVEPEAVDAGEIGGYDLVGFGSGIFNWQFHPRLRRFVRSLPDGMRGRAFVLATSGLPEPRFRPATRPFTRALEGKGFTVDDAFACRGYDTWLPFRLVGGVSKAHPDVDDLAAARAFAERLRTRIVGARP